MCFNIFFFFFLFKQKTAYEIDMRLEFRRVLFRSNRSDRRWSRTRRREPRDSLDPAPAADRLYAVDSIRAATRSPVTSSVPHSLLEKLFGVYAGNGFSRDVQVTRAPFKSHDSLSFPIVFASMTNLR